MAAGAFGSSELVRAQLEPAHAEFERTMAANTMAANHGREYDDREPWRQ
jgi:hypothetical protein